jgi:hypothetical protein
MGAKLGLGVAACPNRQSSDTPNVLQQKYQIELGTNNHTGVITLQHYAYASQAEIRLTVQGSRFCASHLCCRGQQLMNDEQTRYGSPLRTGLGELQSAFRFPVRMPASPTDTPPHDVLVVAAESAFAFVSRPGREWARELLFSGLGGDVAGDVAALSNVDAFALGEMAEFVVASTPASRGGTRDGAVPVPGSEPPEDSGARETATHSRFLWIPSLVHDGITVGMVVHRVDAVDGVSTFASLPQPGEPGIFLVGRFVREELSGETLVLSKAYVPGAGGRPMATVLYLKFKTSSRRHHMFMQCDARLLARTSQAPRHFAETCVFADVSVTDFDCSVCGMSPRKTPVSARCSCKLPFLLPNGPRDFTRFRLNSLPNLGVFAGKSIVFAEQTNALCRLPQSTVVTTSRLAGPSNNDLATAMRTLALQDRLGQGSVCYGVSNALGTASIDRIVHTGEVTSELDAAYVEIATFDDLGCRTVAFSCDPTLESTQDEPAFGAGNLLSDIFTPSGALRCEQPTSSRFDSAAEVSDPSAPVCLDWADNVAPRSPAEENEDESARALVARLAAARDRRRLERQERNRRSAARSNARRREQRAALEQALLETKVRERELRERRALLTAENLQLRERVARLCACSRY